MSQNNVDDIKAVLEELASHGILTWEPYDEANVKIQLLPLPPGEGSRVLALLSPVAQLLWRNIVDTPRQVQAQVQAQRN
jgi:hypothetical protein